MDPQPLSLRADSAPPRPVERYLAHRTRYEWLILGALFFCLTLANTHTVWLDLQRLGRTEFKWSEVLIWEATSHIAWLSLFPLTGWWIQRFPLRWETLRRHLPAHFLGALCVSALHVLGMVALRKLFYWALGEQYVFGDIPSEFVYEALKDVRSYAMVVALWMSYEFLLLRWQGEASEIADESKAGVAGAPADRFLVRTLGHEFLIAAKDVLWVQAQGNYVNLHRDGRNYPLRATLKAMEERLAPSFVRCHRSYLVQTSAIASLQPTEFGDAVLHLRGGGEVPCSRSHVDAVRQQLLVQT
jgi:uncharacterized membrane protein